MGGIWKNPERFPISAETDILNALIAAATGFPDRPIMGSDPHPDDTDRWPGFLRELSRVTGAASARLDLVVAGRVLRTWQVGADLPAPAPDLAQMRYHRVYSQTDLPGRPTPDRPIRALKWGVETDMQALLVIQREDRDFRALDGLQLANLTPYLGQVTASWRALDRERARAALDRRISADLGCGWMILGPAGVVAEISQTARQVLDTVPGLRLRSGGWIECPDPQATQDLRRAIGKAQAGATQPQLVTLAPNLQIALTPALIGTDERLLGLLRRIRPARSLPVGDMAAMLGLSRSEARLAALICDGSSLRDAAETLGWTLETTRSTSKQIFARLGAGGQGDVIRQMLGSALWLALPPD